MLLSSLQNCFQLDVLLIALSWMDLLLLLFQGAFALGKGVCCPLSPLCLGQAINDTFTVVGLRWPLDTGVFGQVSGLEVKGWWQGYQLEPITHLRVLETNPVMPCLTRCKSLQWFLIISGVLRETSNDVTDVTNIDHYFNVLRVSYNINTVSQTVKFACGKSH